MFFPFILPNSHTPKYEKTVIFLDEGQQIQKILDSTRAREECKGSYLPDNALSTRAYGFEVLIPFEYGEGRVAHLKRVELSWVFVTHGSGSGGGGGNVVVAMR